jgi:drug/metabolite transporter (DMT)-like permease
VSAVFLACISALLFGGMSVGLRIALQRSPFIEVATLATVVPALLVASVCVAVDSAFRSLHFGAAWPFVLAGLISPGGAQLFVTLAIRDVGASRTSVVLGTAPLVSVTIALIFLGEPLSAALLVGAALVVAGGVKLARERDRPEHLLSVGLVFAVVGTVLFAIRDNVLRWLAVGSDVPPTVAAAASR